MFIFKQKTAYEMRISDWSSDVCSSDLMLIEGETPTTMAKSTGLGLLELPTVFDQLRPDIVVTVGDRFETMATTLAAAYMNLPIAHTMEIGRASCRESVCQSF